MYEIGTVAQFESAHRLVGDFGPATRVHGHTYRLEVTVRGDRLEPSKVLLDVGRLDALVAAVVERVHLRDLDSVQGLAGSNTTAEAVAEFCWRGLAEGLQRQGLASLHVRVWESPRVFGGYEAPLTP